MPRGGARDGAGRPRLPAAVIAQNTWDDRVRAVKLVLQNLDDWAIVREGIKRHVHDKVGYQAACLVDQACESEQVAEEMARKLAAPEAKRLSKDDALCMLLHLKFSKHQYMQFAKMMNKTAVIPNENGENLVPCYTIVSEHKRFCRPQNVVINEAKAKVPLKDLLKHTIERLVLANELKVKEIADKRKSIRCELTFTYGWDSSTGHRQYKMKFNDPENENLSDNSLFAAVMSPLVLKTADNKIIWQNDFPQSSLFVRTFYLEYADETKEFVRWFNHEVQNEITGIEEFIITTSYGLTLRVRIRAHLTNIDGKIFNILTHTNTQQCPVCGAGRTEMGDVDNIGTETFAAMEGAESFGVQSMHAIIKFFMLLLNVAFRLPAHNEGLQGAEKRAKIKETTERIKARCKQLWGIRVQGPGQGGAGTSMDGNTSRRAFKDPEVLARELGLNVDIVRRFKTIITCINSTQYRLNLEKFEQFALETYRLYMEHYGWFTMSPSVHKILVHAAQIQARFDVPLGAASESGGELMHRIRKDVRLNSTRKTGRLPQMQDLMNRCFDLSDPVLSTKAEPMLDKFRVRTPLPPEALALLDLRTPGDGPNPNPVRPVRLGRRIAGRPPAVIPEVDDNDSDPDYAYSDDEGTDYEFDLNESMDVDP